MTWKPEYTENILKTLSITWDVILLILVLIWAFLKSSYNTANWTSNFISKIIKPRENP